MPELVSDPNKTLPLSVPAAGSRKLRRQEDFQTNPQRTKTAISAWQMQLTHYTSGVTGDIEVAREIVQEAFMRFWKTDDEKIPQELEKAWLYRVCRNLAIDHRRRQGFVIAVGDQNELDSFSNAAPHITAGPDNDAMAEVMTHVEKLSTNQQEVIRLRYQHDLSYKEISKITGHSVSNVGVLIHEAMRRLKKLMSGDEGPSTEGAV